MTAKTQSSNAGTAASMHIHGPAIVVHLCGDSRGKSVTEWQSCLACARGAVHRNGAVIADLSGVNMLGAAGLAALAAANEACRRAGKPLRLALIPPSAVPQLANLDPAHPFTMYPSVADALAGTHASVTTGASAEEADYADIGPLFAQLAALEAGPARERLRQRIITICLPLADNISRRYARRGESAEDLYQIACVGLVKAVDRYDLAHERNFLAFAVPTVLGEVRRYFRDNSWGIHVPRAVKEDFLRLRTATDRVSHRLGRSPNVPEVAAELDWPSQRVTETMLVGNAYRPDQLETAANGQGGEDWSFADSYGAEDPAYSHVEHRLTVRPLIAALPDRERAVLTMRFFQDMTQTQIAHRLGISQMHVSRILAKTLSELRAGTAGSGWATTAAGTGTAARAQRPAPKRSHAKSLPAPAPVPAHAS